MGPGAARRCAAARIRARRARAPEVSRLCTDGLHQRRRRQRRVSTAELNRFLATLDFERAPVPQSRRIKIYYLTQAEAAPPTFVLFVDKPRPLHFSFRRFLENQIRRAFGFLGTPIEFKLRVSGAAR